MDNSLPSERDDILGFSKSDSRILFVDRGDIGVTKARKLGAELSRGKLFALMDSDDYWEPTRLEKHLAIWSQNLIGLSWDRWAEVHGGFSRNSAQPFSEGLIPPPRVARRLYGWNFIHASSGIVPTKFARTLGFPLLNIMSSDWTLFMRAAELYAAYFIGDTLSFKEIDSPDRVTDTEASDFFLKEVLIVRKWALLNRPGIYGMQFLKRKIRQTIRRVGLDYSRRPIALRHRQRRLPGQGSSGVLLGSEKPVTRPPIAGWIGKRLKVNEED